MRRWSPVPALLVSVLPVVFAGACSDDNPALPASVPRIGPDAAAAPDTASPPSKEDVVRIEVNGRRWLFRGTSQVRAECIGGHRGFAAGTGTTGEALHLNAFVARPGTYDCADPMPFIFLEWRAGDAGAGFTHSARITGSRCTLTIDQVYPRLTATLVATLGRTDGRADEAVLTDGAIDVAMPRDCP